MTYRIFFQAYGLGEAVPSTAPVTVDLRRLLRLIEDKLREPDDYLGLVDAEDRILQIQREGEDLYRVEFPDFERRRSLCRPFGRAALADWLEGLTDDFSRADRGGFSEAPWPHPP